jgi:uncharacterized caspase-like protein
VLLAVAAGPVAARAEKRVALVIGNATYQYTASLPNPANDADDMARALKKVGFEVIAVKNVDKRSLERAMADFGRLAQEADAALVYYAGHGIQYQGLNYLMPVDARLEDEYSVNYELTRIDDVLFSLSKARGVRILILDACRNNPLAERLRSRRANRDFVPTRGLARIEAPRGMLVAFATQSDQIAATVPAATARSQALSSKRLKNRELKLPRCSAVLLSMSISRPAVVNCLNCPFRCRANFISIPATPTSRHGQSCEAQATGGN